MFGFGLSGLKMTGQNVMKSVCNTQSLEGEKGTENSFKLVYCANIAVMQFNIQHFLLKFG